MPSIDAPPFLVPPPDAVVCEPWTIEIGGLPEALPARLRDWDPKQDISVKRNLQVQTGRIFEACELSHTAKVALVVSWRSPGSGQRGSSFRRNLEKHFEPQLLLIDTKLPGAELAGSVRISTRLILAEELPQSGQLSPHRAGSILWEDEVTVMVEGLGSRFPMEVVDFRDIGFPLKAAWRLYWHRGTLHADAMGCMFLLLNKRHRRIVGAATRPVPDPETRAIWSAINVGVAREILCSALEDEEFIADPLQFKEGSVGHVARNLGERAFPGESPQAILERLRESPDLFGCSLQAAFGLFDPDLDS